MDYPGKLFRYQIIKNPKRIKEWKIEKKKRLSRKYSNDWCKRQSNPKQQQQQQQITTGVSCVVTFSMLTATGSGASMTKGPRSHRTSAARIDSHSLWESMWVRSHELTLCSCPSHSNFDRTIDFFRCLLLLWRTQQYWLSYNLFQLYLALKDKQFSIRQIKLNKKYSFLSRRLQVHQMLHWRNAAKGVRHETVYLIASSL